MQKIYNLAGGNPKNIYVQIGQGLNAYYISSARYIEPKHKILSRLHKMQASLDCCCLPKPKMFFFMHVLVQKLTLVLLNPDMPCHCKQCSSRSVILPLPPIQKGQLSVSSERMRTSTTS